MCCIFYRFASEWSHTSSGLALCLILALGLYFKLHSCLERYMITWYDSFQIRSYTVHVFSQMWRCLSARAKSTVGRHFLRWKIPTENSRVFLHGKISESGKIWHFLAKSLNIAYFNGKVSYIYIICVCKSHYACMSNNLAFAAILQNMS